MSWLLEALPRLVALVPVLPLLAAAGIALHVLSGQAHGDEGEPLTRRVAAGCAWASLAVVLVLDAFAIAAGVPGQVRLGRWFDADAFVINVAFLVDGLSLPLATLIALIAVITLRFSGNYLHREPGLHRFFLALCLFIAGMQLIVLAGNLVLVFVGWELAGVSSFLLIAYAYDRPVATGNALFAFVANRIGDAGLLVAIALALLWIGSADWPALGGTLDKLTARLIALGLVTAALAKSAQLPFSPWIARALEGPTPSSAIFYGALMVHAGVYLVIRSEPLLRPVPDVMVLLACIGTATAVYGYLAGLVQSDVKSSLIFATVTQVGLMFLECGLDWFALAAWHMGLHACWRAYQFLMAPSYMHLVSAAAAPAPPWLAQRQWLYTAALQRFWVDHLAQALLVRPAQALARDLRRLDEDIIGPLAGAPGEVVRAGDRGDGVMRSPGIVGLFLLRIADPLQRMENRLLLQAGGGALSRLLHRLGRYLAAVESLLEQPRYLLLLVLATFAVIL